MLLVPTFFLHLALALINPLVIWLGTRLTDYNNNIVSKPHFSKYSIVICMITKIE